MTADRRRLGGALLLLALVVLAGCTGENPRTEVVCENCVSAMSESGRALNASVTVEESVTHVYVQRSGDARVEARMQLSGSGVDKLRSDERLVDGFMTVVGDSTRDGTRPAFDRRDLAGRMDGDEFVVTFQVADFAEQRPAGTTLSTRFFRQDGEGRSGETRFDEPHRIETDRLVVHGPDGTEPIVQPPGATATDGRVVWEGDSVATRSYLAFGAGGPLSPLVARAIIALDVVSWAALPAIWGTVVPFVLLGTLATALVLRYRSYVADSGGWSPRTDWLFWVLFGTTGTVAAGVGGALFDPRYGVLAMAVSLVAIGIAWRWQRPGAASSNADDGDHIGSGESGDRRRDRVSGASASRSMKTGPAETVPTETGPPDSDSRDTWPGPSRRVLLSTTLTAVGVLVLSALVAADYGAVVAGYVARGAALLPLLTFPALGYLIVARERTALTASLVVLTWLSPWLFAFTWVVAVGADEGTPALLTFVWAIGVVFAGLVLFYVALWCSSGHPSRESRPDGSVG